MAKVLGVGGIFFKSKDPKALMDWYQRALGIPGEAGYVAFPPGAVPPGGATLVEKRQDHGEYGSFGWFMDPDGNKVELWQPATQG